MRTRHALLAALGLVAVALPATATAAQTVSLVSGTLTIVGTEDDDTMSIGSAGSNALGPTTRVSGRDMVGGTGCQGFGDPNGPANDDSVFCPTNDIQRISVTLLGGDDAFTNSGDLDATVDAGAGDDEVDLGSGAKVVQGGPGDDEIEVGGNGGDGANSLEGGADDDVLHVGAAGSSDDIAGGTGIDRAVYTGHAAVTVTLDDIANDGSSGEGDNVRSDVEDVVGSGSGDTIVGDDDPNTLDGAGGNDRLEGRGGGDILIGGPGVDTLLGGSGDDDLRLRDGITDACPDGGSGTDTIDLDLADQFVPSIVPGLTVRRICPNPAFAALRPNALIVFRAVNEGPSSRAFLLPYLEQDNLRVRLVCPAVLRAACAGRLRVATRLRGGLLGQVDYRVRAGRAAVLRVPLSPGARRALRGRGAVVVTWSERGRSRLGPKTSALVAPVRRAR